MKALLELFFKHKDKIKVASGAGAGSGIILLIAALYGDIKAEINTAEARSKAYAEAKFVHAQELISKDIQHLKGGQKLLLDAVKTIDRRMYEMNKHKGE